MPVKPPSQAKERLADTLEQSERRELAVATLRTVVQAIAAAGLELAVVTPDREAVAGLLPPGTVVIAESAAVQGLTAQIEAALARPSFAAFSHVLILHADLPLASADALRALAACANDGLTMVESADGGTNALLAPLPLRFRLQYGRGSFGKHQTAAVAAGSLVSSLVSPALALDLDTPGDLRTLLSTPEGRSSPAGRLLVGWGLPERLAAL